MITQKEIEVSIVRENEDTAIITRNPRTAGELQYGRVYAVPTAALQRFRHFTYLRAGVDIVDAGEDDRPVYWTEERIKEAIKAPSRARRERTRDADWERDH